MEDKLEQQLESQLGDAGFSFSDTMPEGMENAPQEVPGSFDIDLSTAPAEPEVQEQVQEEVQEPVQESEEPVAQPVEEPAGESSLNT